jgi:biotin carboxylase
MSGRILIIGGRLKTVQDAKSLGLDVTYIQQRDAYGPEHRTCVEDVALIDYTQLERLLPVARALYEIAPFRHVISLTEIGLIPAAVINDALGLAGNSAATTVLLKDKSRMRAFLNARGTGVVACAVGRDERDIGRFADERGLPVVVKPVDGMASIGVHRIDERSQVAGVCRALHEAGIDRFLVEEYLDGPEVSVETLTFDGRHVVVAITDKLVGPRFVEMGHSIPSRVPAAQRAEIAEAVTCFLDLVGLRVGPAHTEIKLSPRGPLIVESHNRMGGDMIPELALAATGVDMAMHTLGGPFDLIAPLTAPPPMPAGAAIRFLTAPTGLVASVDGLDEVRLDPRVIDAQVSVEPGGEVQPLVSSMERVGHVAVQASSVEEAVDVCNELAQRVRIVTEPRQDAAVRHAG